MRSELVAIRYPDGITEFRLAAATPRLGDTLKRGEDEWKVLSVETDSSGNTVVTLAPPGDGQAKQAES